jgi:hypothetical protein
MQLFKGSSDWAKTVLSENCESLSIRKLFGVTTKDKVQAFFLQIIHKEAIGAASLKLFFRNN